MQERPIGRGNAAQAESGDLGGDARTGRPAAGNGFACLPRPGTWTRKYRPKRLPRALCGRRVFAIERAGWVVRGCPNACREHGILPPHETVRFSRGSLDKPRGVQYAMHRHHPPGGCYAGVWRTSGGRGCSLARADCPGGRIANAGILPTQARCQGEHPAKVGMPLKRTRGAAPALSGKRRTR